MPMPKFEPTEEQREIVASLSSLGGATQEEICRLIINPRTGRPINERTLRRLFKHELIENLELRKLIIQRFTEAVDKGEAWAVKLGVENVIGLTKNGGGGLHLNIANINNGDRPNAERDGIRVEFIKPTPRGDEPRPDFQPNFAAPRALPHHDGPQLDSTDENAVKPLYTRIEQPEPTRPVPADTPRTYRERREALQERAEIEGWPAENPRVPGNPNRLWRKGRYV